MNILKVHTPQRETGNLGEDEAVKFLKKNGYKILEKNYTALKYEIDIIAKKDNTTAFIEVKTRNIKNLGYKLSRPAASVTPEKQRKIIKAANYYIKRNSPDTQMRLDVIEVYLENSNNEVKVKEIKHLENTFNLNSAYNAGYQRR